MGIFNRHVHGKESAPQAIPPLEAIENAHATDELSQARRARLSKAGAMGNGFVRPHDAQRIENNALQATAERVTDEHEALIATGEAAEEAGRLAMQGAQEAEPVDVQHQLRG